MSEHLLSVRSYRPGDWFGIVGERAVVILPPSEKSRVASLWQLVDDGAGFDVTLDALISGGLRELPSFVLVSTAEGETKVVLRGPARAVFTVDGEEVQLEGSNATTWVERSLHGVERMRISVDDRDEVEQSYTVDGGLFRISALEEAPAHEGAPEYDPGPGLDADEVAPPDAEPAETDEDVVGLDALLAGPQEASPESPEEESVEEPEEEPAPAPAWSGRSPEPPSWTPPPPPPVSGPWAPVVEQPETEAMTVGPPAEHADADLSVARLMISNGESIEVDRAIVIGRAPEARRFSGTEEPRLVTVPSPQLEISAAHVEVRPGSGADEGSAVVTDLGSTNGTVIVQPGRGPEDLEPGVAVPLIPGAVIDLGDGVTIQVLQG